MFKMKAIAISLIVFGIIGLLLSFVMYGDIGIAAAIGSITAILCGIGFSKAFDTINSINKSNSHHQ
jgi:energy-converting hydrogenase Eha subunit C